MIENNKILLIPHKLMYGQKYVVFHNYFQQL